MRTVVMGTGQVGSALATVLRSAHAVYGRDLANANDLPPEPVDVLNICFPYSPDFLDAAADYVFFYKPALTIIHSTVAIGATRKLAAMTRSNVVHSPVNGQHDILEEALRKFRKAVGPVSGLGAALAAMFLREAGMESLIFSCPEETEAAKLLCTTRYGKDIEYQKRVKQFCEQRGIDFGSVYTEWTRLYNDGYRAVGREQFCRPVIAAISGKIGGTCVISNARLITKFQPAAKLLEFDDTL